MSYVSGHVDNNGRKTQTSRLTYRQHFASFANSGPHSPITSRNTNRIEEPSDSEGDTGSEIFNFSAEIDDEHHRSNIVNEKINDSVPALELHSSDSFPSSNNLTYSYRKGCDVAKSIKKPDAYREWLDAKRTAKAFDLMKRKCEENKQNEEKEKRKMEAENKYKAWLETKAKTQEQNKKRRQNVETAPIQLASMVDTHDKEENYKAWLDRKLRQEKSIKEKAKIEILQQQKLETLRKEKSSEIYGDWLKKAPTKPKPVPLNRGLFSLKGSVSEMYVNPVAWVRVDQSPSENQI